MFVYLQWIWEQLCAQRPPEDLWCSQFCFCWFHLRLQSYSPCSWIIVTFSNRPLLRLFILALIFTLDFTLNYFWNRVQREKIVFSGKRAVEENCIQNAFNLISIYRLVIKLNSFVLSFQSSINETKNSTSERILNIRHDTKWQVTKASIR